MSTLEYSTHSGYGNQMQALLTAVFLTNISNRTLSLRPMLPHDFIGVNGAEDAILDKEYRYNSTFWISKKE